MKKYSITEIFGPTMQGEGPFAGRKTVFVRLHFCDGDGKGNFCDWCDTKMTWDKNDPRFADYERLTAQEIKDRVDGLHDPIDPNAFVNPRWVTVSGGNPAIQADEEFLTTIGTDYSLQMETQGTIYKPHFSLFDSIVVSPKPPSSGLISLTEDQLSAWFGYPWPSTLYFKVVVFDDEDYEWAVDLYDRVRGKIIGRSQLFYLQAGSPSEGDVIEGALERYKWLVEKWLKDGRMTQATVLPQMHVLVWGRKKGV